ncbi:MAG: hypothetical protein HYR56_28015 [Acidobacteria bacterium]|nr:hypothetical protein [Acidobacteriota bacterium]MBI3427392.1 hypothetical protein [Acidobacteriota bacterium]
MKWKRISKENTQQPASGTYNDWKEFLANEGFNQCVYCAIHEAAFGGQRNFHVEHYRPKSKFASLVNDIFNLYYACAICNVFKSDDWPSEPCADHSLIFYPNPSEVDYDTLFDIDLNTGLVSGKFVVSRYLVEQLHLNRDQLVLERRTFFIYEQIGQMREALRQLTNELMLIGDRESIQFLGRIVHSIATIDQLKDTVRAIRPYTSDQTR